MKHPARCERGSGRLGAPAGFPVWGPGAMGTSAPSLGAERVATKAVNARCGDVALVCVCSGAICPKPVP